jgi:lysozyme
MEMSEHGLELLKDWEGCILHAYKDSAGLPTIGIGHLLTASEKAAKSILINGEHVPYLSGITERQALDLLAQDVSPAVAAVNKAVTVSVTQNQFDALVSFAFNIGTNGMRSSTAVAMLNAGKIDEVPGWLAKWNKAGGKVCDGLIVRRRNEIALFQTA